MDTSKRLFDELLELRPRIKVRRLPRHQMLNPACTFPARLWRCRTELHYKRTVARQGRFIVVHLLTPLSWLSFCHVSLASCWRKA